MTKKTKPVCPECGSDDICLDATATWDAINQNWEVESTQDNGWCHACENVGLPEYMSDGEFKYCDWVDAGLDPAPLPKCQQPRNW